MSPVDFIVQALIAGVGLGLIAALTRPRRGGG
jgi:hypothetical protein